MKEKKVLLDAIESGTIVKVVYKYGSQPGHAREILPLKIENNELFAKCLNSNTKKTFFINKLTLLSDLQYSKLPKWDPDFISLTDFEIFESRLKKRNKMVRIYSVIIGFSVLCLAFIILK